MAYKKINPRATERDDLFENGEGEERRSRAVLLSDIGVPRSASRGKQAAKPPCYRQASDHELTEYDFRGKKPSRNATCVAPERLPDGDDSCEAGYAVLDVHPAGEGELVTVVMTCPVEEGDLPRGVERVTVRLLVEQYATLSPKRGALSPEQADALLCAGRLAEAVRRAASLLQYGDQSERRLIYKLTMKGIDRAVAEEAAAYLADKGLIAEDRGAIRRAEQGVRKLWGSRRIREDLRAQGYSREAIEAAVLALEDSDVDFVRNCLLVIRRKWGELPSDRAARAKCRAALLRLGYESETVREAERRLDWDQ